MKILISLLMTVSFLGCLKTRSELRGQVSDDSLRTGSDGRFVSGDVNQKQSAQIDGRFFEINKDFRQLYGKIESLEKQVSDMGAKNAGASDALTVDNKKMIEIEKRLGTLEEAIIALDKKLSYKEPAKSSSVLRGDLKPKGPFGMGEELFAKRRFEEAIQSYEKYRRRYPRGKRYAQATLKIGLCFQKLRMPEDAKAFYKEVIQRYPKTKTAKAANSNLKSI